MTFRKDSLLFYQIQIVCIVMAIICLPLIPILGLKFFLLFISLFILLILVNPKLYNEFIIINETGILCEKSKNQLWAYEWDCIAELKRSSRFMMPSIEVITYNKYGKSEKFAFPNHYFQLGRTAKEAIKKYYRPAERTLNQQLD